MSKTLKLTVNKTWFDMFKAGIKKEEYRELKPYWIKRLFKYPEIFSSCSMFCVECKYRKDFDNLVGCSIQDKTIEHTICNIHKFKWNDNYFKEFDFVELTNGYSKKSPQLTFEFKGTRIDNDYNMDWGGHLMCDEEGHKQHCFIISVGREVGRQNC